MQANDAVDYTTRGLNPHRLGAIREFAGHQVLDVGCGSGAYVMTLGDEFDIRGMDYREFPTWSARPDRFSISDAHSLPVPDGSVDSILAFETLEHLQDPERALREYFRVCRRNVIITVPNCELTAGMRASGVIFNHWIDRTHINFWTMDELRSLVESVGFRIVDARKVNAIRLGPILMEAIGLGGWLARLGSLVVRALARHKHPMTLLLIAGKPGAD